MTVGEVISMLTKYASDDYSHPFMSTDVCDIEVYDDYITIYTTGSNNDVIIYVGEKSGNG